MNRILATRIRAYLFIVLMAVAGATCRVPDDKETVSANASSVTTSQDIAAANANFLLQSTDGGETWQDISAGLPVQEQPEGFFASASEVYVHLKTGIYRSTSNSETPVWEKQNIPDLENRSSGDWSSTQIALNPSGVVAYNGDGELYQKTSAAETWLPIYNNFKQHGLRTVFETADGMLLLGYEHGLYKSSDRGSNWKLVQKGPAYHIVESEGVLMATRGTGIMRSTDKGEHWEGIISEGRVGHGVDRIDGGFIVVSDGNLNKSRRVRISLDGGDTWKDIGATLPPSLSISSIAQAGQYLICGHPDGIFRSSDMGKTWMRVYAGAEQPAEANIFIKASYSTERIRASRKIFTIYKSGSTLYAVAKVAGC